jgi:hypothetical protein
MEQKMTRAYYRCKVEVEYEGKALYGVLYDITNGQALIQFNNVPLDCRVSASKIIKTCWCDDESCEQCTGGKCEFKGDGA